MSQNIHNQTAVTHEFVLVRTETPNHAAAVVRLTSNIETDSETVWGNFKKAVTAWAHSTTAGTACWEESVEDLNIGDLLNHDAFNHDAFSRTSFRHILREHGIKYAAAESLLAYTVKRYDEHLVIHD
jgi:hypothetical protein